VAALLVVVTAVVTLMVVRPGRETDDAHTVVREGKLSQLTLLPGRESFPTLSPDGEYLAYSSNGDIHLKRVGGERLINLTEDSPANDYYPAFSPDGKSIAFRSERGGGGIFLMGATGESVRRLTDLGFDPAWSPSGEEIAYATDNGDNPRARGGVSQIWAVNVASGQKRLIFEGDAVQPSWSPDGSRIAYWSSAGHGAQRDIWTIPATGGEAVAVTNDIHVDWNPVWSPDGKFLYFSSERGGSMNLWRAPIEEESGAVLGPPERVTTGATADRSLLSFSADGRKMAYVESVYRQNIWKAAIDSATGAVTAKPAPVTEGARAINHVDISPDGNWLTYRTMGKQEDVFVSRTDNTGLRQLTDDLHRDLGTRWSPDGKKIAHYSNRSGYLQIWTINADGSELRQLTQVPGHDIGFPVWSPDGKQMAFWDFDENRNYIFDPNRPWDEQTPRALPPLADGNTVFRAWSWSPDGLWLAGWTAEGIVVYSLETQQYRKLSDFGVAPRWLSDGRRLLFFETQGAVYLANMETGAVGEVFSLERDWIRDLSLSSDDQWIYFVRVENEADIWMLTLNEEQK
jgi:Tol biopolymer transport system component